MITPFPTVQGTMRCAFVLLALLPVAASAAPAPDGPGARAAAKPKCLGKTATIVGTKRSDGGFFPTAGNAACPTT